MANLAGTHKGPRGAILEVYDDDTVAVVTEYGYGFSITLDDFEAFVAYWNSRSPFTPEGA